MTTPRMPAGQPAWTIVGQTEGSRLGADGRFGTGVLITFRTAQGLQGTVFVPDGSYTPEYVRGAVAARVAAMEQVQGLTG